MFSSLKMVGIVILLAILQKKVATKSILSLEPRNKNTNVYTFPIPITSRLLVVI